MDREQEGWKEWAVAGRAVWIGRERSSAAPRGLADTSWSEQWRNLLGTLWAKIGWEGAEIRSNNEEN